MVSQVNATQGNNSLLDKAKNKSKKDSKFLDMFENLGKTTQNKTLKHNDIKSPSLAMKTSFKENIKPENKIDFKTQNILNNASSKKPKFQNVDIKNTDIKGKEENINLLNNLLNNPKIIKTNSETPNENTKIETKQNTINNAEQKNENLKDFLKLQEPMQEDVKEGKIDSKIENKKEENLINLNEETNKQKGEKGGKNEEQKSPMSIKNTLKYGAFSAFDALSLLKPSNEKKLSELIKKADELALNLEKIKYEGTKEVKEIKLQNEIQIKNENLKDKLISKIENKAIENKENKIENNKVEEKLDSLLDSTKDKKTPPPKVDSKLESKLDSNPKEPPKVDSNKGDSTLDSNTKKENSKQNTTHLNLDSNKESNIKEEKLDAKAEIKQNSINNAEQKAAKLDEKNAKPALASLKIEKDKKDEIKASNESKNEINIENKQMQRNYESKEMVKNLVHQIQKEITNYKPPMQRITLELNPANLGNVEVVITHQGKNIQVQLQGNQNTLNLLMQNNMELRNALSSIGYENVSMSFSNGSSMGFSDRNGNWQWEKIEKNGNENSLEKEEEMANLEIMIINNYA